MAATRPRSWGREYRREPRNGTERAEWCCWRLEDLARMGWDARDIGDAIGLEASGEVKVLTELMDGGWLTPSGKKSRRQRMSTAAYQAVARAYADLADCPPNRAYVDPVVVVRLTTGHPPASFTKAERLAAVAELTRQGLTAKETAARMGISERQVTRERCTVRQLAGVA